MSDLGAWLDGLVALAGKSQCRRRRVREDTSLRTSVAGPITNRYEAILDESDDGRAIASLAKYLSEDDAKLLVALDPDAIVVLVNVAQAGLACGDALRDLVRLIDDLRPLLGDNSISPECLGPARDALAALRAAEASGR